MKSEKMSRNKITRRHLKPWLEFVILTDTCVGTSSITRARSVKIIDHVAGVTTGKCTKHVTDGQVYITAHFTQDAVQRFLLQIEESDQSTNWASALVILHEYTVEYIYHPTMDQNLGEVVLHVNSFKLWDLQEGFTRKNQLTHVMDIPAVRKLAADFSRKVRDRLAGEISQSTHQEDSLIGGESDSVGLTQLLEEMGRASPEVLPRAGPVVEQNNTQGPPVKHAENTACIPAGLLEKLFAPLSYEEFVVTEEAELEQIKEWQADYRPSGSPGMSDSVDGHVPFNILSVSTLTDDHSHGRMGERHNQVADSLEIVKNASCGEGRSVGIPKNVQQPALVRGLRSPPPLLAPGRQRGQTAGTSHRPPDPVIGIPGIQAHSGYMSLTSQDVSMSQVDSCAWQEEIDSVRLSLSDSPLNLSSPTATSTQIDQQCSQLKHPIVKPALSAIIPVEEAFSSRSSHVDASQPSSRGMDSPSYSAPPAQVSESSVQRPPRSAAEKQSTTVATRTDSFHESQIYEYSSETTPMSTTTDSNPSISDINSGNRLKQTKYRFVAKHVNSNNIAVLPISSASDQNIIMSESSNNLAVCNKDTSPRTLHNKSTSEPSCSAGSCLTLGTVVASENQSEMQAHTNANMHCVDQGTVSHSSNSDQSISQSLLRPTSHSVVKASLVATTDSSAEYAGRRQVVQAVLNLRECIGSDKVDQDFTGIKEKSENHGENVTFESMSHSTLLTHCRLLNPSVVNSLNSSSELTKSDDAQVHDQSVSYSSSDGSIISPSPPGQNPRYPLQRHMQSVSLTSNKKPAVLKSSVCLSGSFPLKLRHLSNSYNTNESETPLHFKQLEDVKDQSSLMVESTDSVNEDGHRTHSLDSNVLTDVTKPAVHTLASNSTEHMIADVHNEEFSNISEMSMLDSEHMKCQKDIDTDYLLSNVTGTRNHVGSLKKEKSVVSRYYSSALPSPRKSKRLIKERLLKALNSYKRSDKNNQSEDNEEPPVEPNANKSTSVLADTRCLRPRRHASNNVSTCSVVLENVAGESEPVELNMDLYVVGHNDTEADEVPLKGNMTEDLNMEKNINLDSVNKNLANTPRIQILRKVEKKTQSGNRITIETDSDTDTEHSNSTCKKCASETNDNGEYTSNQPVKLSKTVEIIFMPDLSSNVDKECQTGTESFTAKQNSVWRKNQITINKKKIKEINMMNAKIRKRIREERQKRLATISDNTHLLNSPVKSLSCDMECDETPNITLVNSLDNSHVMSSQATQTGNDYEESFDRHDNHDTIIDMNTKCIISLGNAAEHGGAFESQKMLQIDSETSEKAAHRKKHCNLKEVCHISIEPDEGNVANAQNLGLISDSRISSGCDTDVPSAIPADSELDNGSQGLSREPTDDDVYRSTLAKKAAVGANTGANPWVSEFCNWIDNHEESGCHSECTQCNQSPIVDSHSALLQVKQSIKVVCDSTKETSLEDDIPVNISETVSTEFDDSNQKHVQSSGEMSEGCRYPISKQSDNSNVEPQSGTLPFEIYNFPDTQEFLPTHSDILQTSPSETLGTQPLGTQPFDPILSQTPQWSFDSDRSPTVLNQTQMEICGKSREEDISVSNDVNLESENENDINNHSQDIGSNNVRLRNKTDINENCDDSSAQIASLSTNAEIAFKKLQLIETMFEEIDIEIESQLIKSSVNDVKIASQKWDNISKKIFENSETELDENASCEYVSDSEVDIVLNEHTNHKKRFDTVKNKSEAGNFIDTLNNKAICAHNGSTAMAKLCKNTNMNLKKRLDSSSLTSYIAEALGRDTTGKHCSSCSFRVKPIDCEQTRWKTYQDRRTHQKPAFSVKPVTQSRQKYTAKLVGNKQTSDKFKPDSVEIEKQPEFVGKPDKYSKSSVTKPLLTYEPQLFIDGHCVGSKRQWMNLISSPYDRQDKTDESTTLEQSGRKTCMRKRKEVPLKVDGVPEPVIVVGHDGLVQTFVDGPIFMRKKNDHQRIKLQKGNQEMKGQSTSDHGLEKGKSKGKHFAGSNKSENDKEPHSSKRRKTTEISDEIGMKKARVAEWVHAHSPLAVTRTPSPGHSIVHGSPGVMRPTSLSPKKTTDIGLPASTTQEQWDKFLSTLMTPTTKGEQLLKMKLPVPLNKCVTNILQGSSKK